MKKQILFICFITHCFLSHAQGGTWTWVKGVNTVNAPGNIGVMGVSNAANYPEGRYQAANWIDLDGNFWIFGGIDRSNKERNDLWKYNPNTNIWTWVNGSLTGLGIGVYGTQGIPSPNNIPGARGWGIVSWTDKQGRLWLHGGYGYDDIGGYGSLDDMWMYDILSNQWTWMKGSSSNGTVVDYGILQVPSATSTPGGIQECNTAWVKSDGTLWTFGGDDNTQSPNNAMWKFDIATNNWTWMGGGTTPANYGTLNVEAPSNMPPARGTYTRWQDADDNFYIFGGIESSYLSNDVWKYNTSNNQWTWIAGSKTSNSPGTYTQYCSSNNSVSPSARLENRTAQMLGCSNVFWTFGGFNANFDQLNDLWNFNTVTKQWTWVSGSSTTNATGSYGTINVPNPSNVPPARAGVCMWAQPNGTIWMWSGMNYIGSVFNPYSDMWRFDPDTACLHSVLFVPPLAAQLSDSLICLGDSALLTIMGGHIASIEPSNTTHTLDSVHIALSPATNTTYTVIADGSCGVKDTFYYNIIVAAPPVAGVSLGSTSVVLGQSVSIQNTSTGYDSVYALINGQFFHPVPTSFTFTQTGTNCVTIVAVKNNFCLDSATQCVLVFYDSCSPLLTTSLSPQVICPNDSSYLTITGIHTLRISPAGTYTVVDTNHAWLYPKVTTNYTVIATNRCNKLDTFQVLLKVIVPDTTPIFKTICAGSSFLFNGQSIAIAGTYYDTLQNRYGCDSLIVLHLNLQMPATTAIHQSICNGGSILFNGQNVSAAGVYRDTLSSVLGCDSFIVLTITHNNPPTTVISQSICSGNSIVFNNQTISQAGVYVDTITTVFNCDSIVQLSLSILPPKSSGINAQVCKGDTFFFNGNALTSTGSYSYTFKDMNNCDSIVTLNLTLAPKPTASFSITPIGDTIPFTSVSATNTSLQFDTVLWLLNNQLISHPEALPITSTGNYCLQLVAISNLGCRDTSQQCFYVIDNAFAIPNAFTPNGDGNNDGFYPVLLRNTGITITAFSIYDRWGQLLYNNPALPWDGTFKGEQQPAESYVFHIELNIPDHQSPSGVKHISHMGSFTLLR